MSRGSREAPLAVTYVRRRALLGAAVVLALLAVWGLHHVVMLNRVVQTHTARLGVIYTVLFVMLVWQTFYGYFEKPHRVTTRQWELLQKLNVAVIMPIYNEDEQIVRESIESMLRQTRRLQAISVCDDGSNHVDYYHLREWFYDACAAAGVRGYWTRQPNAGKRHAQVTARNQVAWADIYVLVDSDSVLDPYATQEALKAFADPEVMSVASMVAAANTRHNIFTRVMDLWYVALQFTDRSVMSRFRSVLVNYGALSYYRAEVLDDNLEAYLTETFAGQDMKISDDSLLTLFALLKGQTVQQVTSWAFTYMPTNFKHHKNQQIRWMRGSFIRSLWRFRYLPLARFAFWGHLIKWVQYALATAAFIGVMLTHDLTNWKTVGLFALIQASIYYGVMLRYLTIRRSDESTWYQVGTWLMTPIAAIWALSVLRVWRIYAMLTCVNMAWGTRDKVEVTADGRAVAPRRRTAQVRLAFAGVVVIAAFGGFGVWLMSNTTPASNSVVAHAERAGVPVLDGLPGAAPTTEPTDEPTTPVEPVKQPQPTPKLTVATPRPRPQPTLTVTPAPAASPSTPARTKPRKSPRSTPTPEATTPTPKPTSTADPTPTDTTAPPGGTNPRRQTALVGQQSAIDCPDGSASCSTIS